MGEHSTAHTSTRRIAAVGERVGGRDLILTVTDPADRALLAQATVAPSMTLRIPALGVRSHRPVLRHGAEVSVLRFWLRKPWRGPADGHTGSDRWTLTLHRTTRDGSAPWVITGVHKDGLDHRTGDRWETTGGEVPAVLDGSL